jgi:hypothetical protein
MSQALHLANGATLNEKLKAPTNTVSRLLAQHPEPQARTALVEEAFLTALARFPTPAESTQLVKTLDATPPAERREAVEDLLWALLTSREFLFNH